LLEALFHLEIELLPKIEIKTLVEWKGDGVVIEGSVDLRTGVAQSVILKPCEDFLDPADPYSTSCWGAKRS
jgi:hypothetical protein